MCGTPKVGILTYHFADNFGAVLQAYALQEFLTQLGCDTSIVDYDPDYVSRGGRFVFPSSRRKLKANLITAYQKYVHFRTRWIDSQQQRNSFSEFRKQHLRIRGRRYLSVDELRSDPPACEAYVCGSDQIWNPSPQFGVDSAYFLGFGPESAKRVAYAPSFGRADVEERYYPEIAELVNGLDSVSTREASGVQLVERLAGRKAEWMPDPTLLLNDYSQVLAPTSTDSPYLLLYVLRESGYVPELVKYLSNRLSVGVVYPLTPMTRWKPVGEQVRPGPAEWLRLIQDSEFVVTNSFHGTLFSILLRKQFLSVGLAGAHGALSERAVSLLQRLELIDRFVTSFEPARIDQVLKSPIDWEGVEKRLSQWRGEAKEYLRGALLAS